MGCLEGWRKFVGVGGGYRGVVRDRAAALRVRTLPVATYRLGRLLMGGEPVACAPNVGEVVVYACVSSADQRTDLDRQVVRVTRWAIGRHVGVSRVVTEVGS